MAGPQPMYDQDGDAIVRLLTKAGDQGHTWRELMKGLGYANADTEPIGSPLHHGFNMALKWARRAAEGKGMLIPRPHGKPDGNPGGQLGYYYRVTDILGNRQGTTGTRLGIIAVLEDIITRETTVVKMLAQLRKSPHLPVGVRRMLTQKHTIALGEVAQTEALRDAIMALPEPSVNGAP